MLILLQLLTIAALVAGTFLLFRVVGPQSANLIYTKSDREKWTTAVGPFMTTWFTRTNIIGTVTSLATVYLFFIGSSKLFGVCIFLCGVSMIVGGFVTNYFTTRIWTGQYIQKLVKENDLTGGVIASIFWRPASPEKLTANTVKYLSLLGIAAFIWLDFALFADISGRILRVDSLYFRLLLLALSCFSVIYFTLRYGIRGFVFADIFHAPLIGLATLVLVVGCIILFFKDSVSALSVGDFFKPVLPPKQCLIFALHVLFLNSFFVVLSESHWLRMWVFGNQETNQQKPSLVGVFFLWGLLMLVGFFASDVSGRQGEEAVVGLLDKLANMAWAFPVAFWIGGTSALFSSADSQIYSFLIVSRFDNSTGRLRQMRTAELKPARYALLTTIFFMITYAVVRHFKIPFEKIVFIIMPLTLNILPALILAFRGQRQNPWFIWISLALYAAASTAGFLEPAAQLFWTLFAALMPVLVSIVALVLTWIYPKPSEVENVMESPKEA